jgi:hypothetical protein
LRNPQSPQKGFWGFFMRLQTYRVTTGRDMAHQSQNKFAKRQKELERKRKAEEKMAKRREKKNRPVESDTSVTDQS